MHCLSSHSVLFPAGETLRVAALPLGTEKGKDHILSISRPQCWGGGVGHEAVQSIPGDVRASRTPALFSRRSSTGGQPHRLCPCPAHWVPFPPLLWGLLCATGEERDTAVKQKKGGRATCAWGRGAGWVKERTGRSLQASVMASDSPSPRLPALTLRCGSEELPRGPQG